MIRILKIIVCVVFVLSLVGKVSSIKCWVCDSNIDPKCSSPFDTSTMTLTDCSTQGSPDGIPNNCFTQETRVNDVWSYIRGCGFTRRQNVHMTCISQVQSGPKGETVFMQYCPCKDKDGCNDDESSAYN